MEEQIVIEDLEKKIEKLESELQDEKELKDKYFEALEDIQYKVAQALR